MLRHELVPDTLLLRDDAAHPLGDELVLRLEVTVQRHLVRAGRLGDRLDADAANADPTKEIVGGVKNSLSRWL